MSRRPTEREIRRALEKLAEKAGEASVADVGHDDEVKVLVGVELEKFTWPDGSDEYLEATTNGRNRRLQVVEDVEALDTEGQKTIGIDPEVLAERDDQEEGD